jgi:cytochrome c peroxidase
MVRILDIPEYVTLFEAAFPGIERDDLGFQHAANAIAAYEMATYTFLDSPWDRYLEGDDSALSDSAKQGAVIFYGKAGCVDCHSGDLMTDQAFHNMAVPHVGPGKGREGPLDYGRARETGSDCDLYAFRTPPLRNVALTGPWMHNGAYTTLIEAVRHQLDPLATLQTYEPSQLTAELIETVRTDRSIIEAALDCQEVHLDTVELTEEEISYLLDFLHALTSPSASEAADLVPDRVPSGLQVGGY